MDQNQEVAIAQLRRAVHNLGSSTESYGDITLKRFLIARSFDIDKAADMFVQWKDWRASFVPLNHIPESEITDELNAEKIYLQGLTTEGHPLMIAKVSKHFPAKDVPQFKKYVVHVLDKTIASGFRGKEIGNEKLILLLDLRQIGLKNVDARGILSRALSQVLPATHAQIFRGRLETGFTIPRESNLRKDCDRDKRGGATGVR